MCVQDSSSLEFTTEYDQLTKPSKSDVIQLGPARKPLQLDVKSVNTTPKPLLAGSSALSRRPILSPIRAYEDSVWTGRGRPLHTFSLPSLRAVSSRLCALL